MSVPVGGGRAREAGAGRARAWGGAGAIHSEVQCIMDNGHIGTTPSPVNRQTDTTENIIFLQLRWREVIIRFSAIKTLI